MILLIDNYDSFTFNLKDYLERLGQEVHVVRNNEEFLLKDDLSEVKGVVLSPGPGIPSESGYLMDFISKNWQNMPILGICLGHQALGIHFGGKLMRAPYPMHGKISVSEHSEHLMFDQIPHRFEVCRYHSLVIDPDEQMDDIEVTAQSDDHCIMALAHRKKPIWGVQYHPEAILTEYGMQLIDNWLKVVNLQNTR